MSIEILTNSTKYRSNETIGNTNYNHVMLFKLMHRYLLDISTLNPVGYIGPDISFAGLSDTYLDKNQSDRPNSRLNLR